MSDCTCGGSGMRVVAIISDPSYRRAADGRRVLDCSYRIPIPAPCACAAEKAAHRG